MADVGGVLVDLFRQKLGLLLLADQLLTFANVQFFETGPHPNKDTVKKNSVKLGKTSRKGVLLLQVLQALEGLHLLGRQVGALLQQVVVLRLQTGRQLGRLSDGPDQRRQVLGQAGRIESQRFQDGIQSLA